MLKRSFDAAPGTACSGKMCSAATAPTMIGLRVAGAMTASTRTSRNPSGPG